MPEIKSTRLANYLKGNVIEKTFTKGLKIFNDHRYTIKSVSIQGKGDAILSVLSDESWDKHDYVVQVSGFASDNSLVLSSCTCSYNYGGICKHRIASIYAVDKYLQALPVLNEKVSMLDSEVNLIEISDGQLERNTSSEIWKNRELIKNVEILSAIDGTAEMVVSYKKFDYKLHFTKLGFGKIQTSCSCNQELFYPLCEHKIAGLLALKHQFGAKAFDVLKDWSAEKNVLLAEYGFSLADNLTNLFDFKITDAGKLALIKLDNSIHKLSEFEDWQTINQQLFRPQPQSIILKETDEEKYEPILIYIFKKQTNEGNIPDLVLEAVTARQHEITEKLTNLVSFSSNYMAKILPPISSTDSKIIAQIQKMEQEELTTWVKKNSTIKGWLAALNENSLPIETVTGLQEIIGEKFEKILPLLAEKRVFISPDNHHNIASMQEVKISSVRVKPSFRLSEDEEFVILEVFLRIGNEKISVTNVEKVSFWFVENQQKLYKINTVNNANLINYFSDKSQIKVKKQNFKGFFKDFILPLTDNAEVNFSLKNEFKHEQLVFKETRIYLKEDEENLLLVPAYVYQDYENEQYELVFNEDGRSSKIQLENNEILIFERNVEEEYKAYNFLENLHPEFSTQGNYPFFYLPFSEVMKKSWLFDFFEKAKETQISVFGYAELKKLKYNTNRPKMNIRNGSGIDWFDMKIEVSFGDQTISLAEIKKAVVKKQNFVELKDGTLGMLPEEWLAKYAQLLKMGTIKGDSVKISKLHFNIIEELLGDINDVALAEELAEKKQKLLNFKEMQAVELPNNIQATLRDYQKEGYKWLHFLDEFSWGGILADDMGLGKTLQMLTFLQEQQNRFPEGTNLVVLPTTLIFNWQAEAEKFCPSLKIFVHRGVVRNKNIAFFKEYDLILTTYGTVRSDIEILKNFYFQYIILDESQAIKNPDSLISKAVRLLTAKNRLVMTGTPVENNTFDLYSQMEFLNPGFLGGQEFFKTEFATPIDKFQDKETAQRLRTLIKPFMLKRTKEEVAKDLPEKTETILYCEMGAKQRKVYETYREMYRQRIVEKMTTDGKEKSSFLILEGLLKLRQICDSPALLSDNTDLGNESAKLEEILREIEENASNHKIVIFSQFLKMLGLIRQHLEKNNIPYEYLDGQTNDRAARVNRFQENEHCRVFLMSLKAGGVGINLTEADYVYLVDPWWNPAVEQQAIDRTHRIGQKKNVFAYRMICKESIEEKILLLQAKKKDIANDLISTESGFIKKLSREDVVELFS